MCRNPRTEKGRNRDVMAEIKTLSFRGVNFSYGTDPCSGRDLSVPQEFLIIIGPTAEARHPAEACPGAARSRSGTISVFGRKPERTGPWRGTFPQDTGRNRDFPITALEVVPRRLGFPGRLSYGKKDRRPPWRR